MQLRRVASSPSGGAVGGAPVTVGSDTRPDT